MAATSDVNMDNYEELGCLHEMFVKQALKTSEKIAVVSANGEKMTFKQLHHASDVLAIKLRRIGVDRNKVVGILMERCVEYTISYLAILKAGGAYLPIEVSYPELFLKSVMADVQPIAVCTKSNYLERLSGSVSNVLLLEYKNRHHHRDQNDNWIDSLQKENTGYEHLLESVKVTLDDMAYIVYSSGTTGKPKGIQCPHRGAVFSYTWRHLAYPYEEDDREACNVFFVWEMLRPLLKGVPMYIIPDDTIYDPPKLLNFLEENRITRMLVTPSLLQAIFENPTVSVQKGFATIRQLWLCGEVVTMSLRNLVASTLPSVKLLNLYSISECHDVAVSDLSSNIKLEDRTYCPCGKVFPRVHVLILDENLNEVPTGSPGEVYVGGPTLAIGYLNQPYLNNQRFIITPKKLNKYTTVFCPRLYKTGDSGYLLSNNCLEIIGRCDTMVKIRGYTIELKAVEVALMSIPHIKMACVLALGQEGTDKLLTAYVVLREGYKENGKSLKNYLKEKLPFYMIPAQVIYLDKIPIKSATGKIDTDLLPRGKLDDQTDDIVIDPSFSEVEKIMAKVWCDVLRIRTIEKDDNFFELGGHSLLAAITVGRINEIFKTNLSTADLYTSPIMEMFVDKLQNGTVSSKLDLKKEFHNNAGKITVSANKLHCFWTSIRRCKNIFTKGNVLLTGVTGYLGHFLLRELLLTSDVTVYGLVRNSAESNAEQRLQKVLHSLNVPSDVSRNRVVCITGDVSLNNFGLSQSDYSSLCYDIDLVIHAASYVNLVLPYNALYRTNVLGTKNVLSFCLRKKLKPLHYVSTNEVFASHVTNRSESHITLDDATKLKSGYGQSKWLSEQLIMTASNAGLPTIISRCGNLSGPINITGWKWNDNDFILYLIRSIVYTQVAPDINWKIEFTPVDFAGKLIVKLTQNIDSLYGKVFHIINTNPVHCRQLYSIMNEIGFNLNIVPYEKWTDRVKSIAVHNHSSMKGLQPLLHSVLKTEEYLSSDDTYERNNLNKFLDSENLSYPAVTRHLFVEYLVRLMNHNYIVKQESVFTTLEKRNVTNANGNSISLEGKLVFVVGASSGIGYSIVEELAKEGATVIAAARTFQNLVTLKETLNRFQRNLIIIKLDIADRYQVKNTVDYIESIYGPINVFVNSAGVMSFCKTANAESEDWLQMLRINCEGALNCVAAVLPKMIERTDGHIVHITSDAGRKAFQGLAVYSGTKFFLEAFSSAMRQEIAQHGVKVTCIQPGDVNTGLHQKSKDKQALKDYSFDIPYLKSKDVSDAVIFALKRPKNCAVNEILVEPILGPL